MGYVIGYWENFKEMRLLKGNPADAEVLKMRLERESRQVSEV